jgi:hypothetical protein
MHYSNLTLTMYDRIVSLRRRFPIEMTALFAADVTPLLDAVVPFELSTTALCCARALVVNINT